jgi:hypothetical protein
VSDFVQAWLKVARATDDPEGDLIEDMRRDKNLPRLFSNIGQMRSYLRQKRACQGALNAIPRVWRRLQELARPSPMGMSDHRLQQFTAAVRRIWPGSKIVLRPKITETTIKGDKSLKFVNKDGQGGLFKSKEKTNPKGPDYHGDFRLNGVDYRIAAWKKQSTKTGETFLSLSVEPKGEKKSANDDL